MNIRNKKNVLTFRSAEVALIGVLSVLLMLGTTSYAETNEIGPADGSFESDLAGTTATGDTVLISGLGILEPTEGVQGLLMTTEPDFGATPADADVSTLLIENFTIDPTYATLRLDYNFLTNEPDPSFANDAFTVTLVLITAGGEQVVLNSDTFDAFVDAPWTGYALQTGFRTMVADVSGIAAAGETISLALQINDLGDGRRDSAVLVDDIRLVEPGVPEAHVASNYVQIAPGASFLFDGTGSVDDVGIVSYSWDFANGFLGDGPLVNMDQYTAPGFYQGTLTVTDADGNSDTANFTVAVGDVNSAPVITSNPITTASENVPYLYQLQVSDAQLVYGDTLSYTLVSGPTGMEVEADTGLVSWTPAVGVANTHAVTVSVMDSFGETDSQSYTLVMGPEVYVAGVRDDSNIYTARSVGDGTFTDFRLVTDIGANSRGLAIADFDGDDDFDLVVGRGANPTQHLYLFQRDAGAFETPVYLGPVGDSVNSSGTWAEDMAAEDFNNDGRMDLLVSGDTANIWLLENTGDLVTEAESYYAGDFETDVNGWGGPTDASAAERVNTTSASGDWSIRVYATGAGSDLNYDLNVSSPVLSDASTIRFAYRIPAGTPAGLGITVLGTGRGWLMLARTASNNAGTYPTSPLAVTLIDDDAWHVAEIDIYQAIQAQWPGAAQFSNVQWWTADNGTAGQQFWFDDFRITRPRMVSGFTVAQTPSAGGSNGRGMDAGDANRDGNMDFVRGRYSSGYLDLYLGDGTGTLTYTGTQIADVGTDPYGVVLADFNNDGNPDVIGNYASNGDPTLLLGNGDGTFQAGTYVASLDTGYYASYGHFDFDDDGNEDIVLADYTGRSLRYFPGNGDGTFAAELLIGNTGNNVLAIAAPAGRRIGQPFARATQDAFTINEGESVNFDAAESYDDGSIVSYEWDFDDGNTATGVTASNVFTGEGNYNVTLRVTDDEGNMDVLGLRVVVNGDAPVADPGGAYLFDESRALAGTWPVTLDGRGSSDTETGIARYEWDFDTSDGIGVDATGPMARATFDGVGTYTIMLTVYDAVGQASSTTTTVTTQGNAAPVAGLVGPATLDETAASFGTWTGWYDASATTDDVVVASYGVDWDDGSSTVLGPMADNFNDGDFNGWTVSGGTWGVSDGEVYQTATGNAWYWLQDRARMYRNFELNVDFKALDVGTDGYVGIAFHHPNTGGSSSAQNSFLIYSRNSWDYWSIYDWNAGTALVDAGTGWDPEIWYHLRLRVEDGTIQLFLTPEGGVETLQAETTSTAHGFGGIGLLAHSQNLRYDNVKVIPLDDQWTEGDRTLADLSHSFAATGDYDVTLTVTDHAGQSASTPVATAVSAGASPFADAGGPYTLDESVAYGSEWEFALDATGSNDDVNVQRYTVDFGDGTTYTVGDNQGRRGHFSATGTDLYGFDTAAANLARIVATENNTFIEIINLETKAVIASNTINRLASWNSVSPGDGVYYKVRASKPVTAYFTNLSAHSTFVPSLEGGPVGREFFFQVELSNGFYIYGQEDAEVTFYNTSGAVVTTFPVRQGEYRALNGISEAVYRVVATGDISMQTVGGNSYTSVPANNGDGAGQLFYFATVAGTTGAVAVFAHEAANVEVFDMDTGASLYTASVAAGDMWYQNALGTRRLRLVADADVEVWAGDTEGGTGIANLGDDISFAGGRNGTEFVLHDLTDGIVIFAPNDGTDISIDGALTGSLNHDEYLALAPADFASGPGVHRIVTSQPVIIQTLGQPGAFNDLGTFLGGTTLRHRYTALGSYTVSLTVTDNAGQTDTTTTAVEVVSNAPPVPVINAPAVADESYAVGGLWTVEFDALGSTDDFGIFSYGWDFGDGSTGTGAEISHQYSQTGTYDVTLTTTDHAGQAVSTTFSVEVTLGAGPVADAGGPYTFGEEAASFGRWTATLDASGSNDDSGIYDYLWELLTPPVDDFDDGVLDTGLWNASPEVTEAGGVLTLAGNNSWTRGFYTAESLVERTPDTEIRMIVHTPLGTQNAMVGLYVETPSSFTYTQMPHAIYFVNSSNLYIYESGANRGIQGSFVAGQSYELRIVLKQTGADYYIRELGATDWNLLYSGTTGSQNRMRIGATVYANSFQFDLPDLDQMFAGRVISLEHTEVTTEPVNFRLRVRDNALQEAYDTTSYEIVDGDDPVAEAAGPYTAEVGSFIAFNGTGSTDDNAIQQFNWRFGDTTGGPDAAGSMTANLPFTGKGAGVRHFYQSPGTYDVELTVVDNTLKTDVDTATVEVIIGDAPVAAVRTPTVGGVNGPPVYFDATQSTDDFGIVEYRWDFDADTDSDGDGNLTNDIDAVGARPFHTYNTATQPAGVILEDDFDAATLDSSVWLSAGATQSGGSVNMTGVGSWGTRYLTSVESFDRQGRVSVQGQVTQGTTGNGYLMWGVKAAGTNYSYTAMPHAIYFINGSLRIYEDGSPRGVVGTYTRGVQYDVRIDLLSTGANYYIRETGTADWTRLTGFSSVNPNNSPLHLHAVVSTGDGSFDNFRAAYIGPYMATLTVEDGAGQTSTTQVQASINANAPPDVVTVPWVAFDPLVPHETYNGKAIHLKGIVRDADPVSYEWDFGDGTTSGVLSVTNTFDLSAVHTYPSAPSGTPFTATLTVTDSAGNTGSATYPVIVRPLNLNTEINIAIDEGLWYLHQQQTRNTVQGYPSGYWTSNARASATASAIQSFQVNGHLESVSHQDDPYAETVMRGLRQLFRDLGTVAIATQTNGEPDTNGNGLGIQTGQNGSGGQPIYQGGQVMDAIASSGNPLARTVTGVDGVLRRSYFDILTDMADQFAWGQVDTGTYQGGWRYSWQSSSDNSAAQWGAIGLLAAQDIFGIPVPLWVKEQNLIWLDNYGNPGWGYTGGAGTRAGTPSGLVQMSLNDQTTDNPRWIDSEAWVADRWTTPNSGYITTEGNRPYYPYYALTKAMRLAKPEPVVEFYDGTDWFRDPEVGLARTLVDDQNLDGSFPGTANIAGQLRSAWGIIILSRTLFVQPPVADAGRDRVWGVDIPLEFDGSGSFHLDPFRSLVEYEWDFDGDGTFDFSSDQPLATYTYTRADYPEASLPTTVTARLRVTDNNIPALTDTDTVEIIVAVPPHPPIAEAAGPYTCTAGLPCELDGSGSFDIDPTDFISLYEWDLDGFPFDYSGATGVNPAPVFTEGLHSISLRVYDNAVLNDVNGNGVQDPEERLTDVDFTSVTAVANLPPVANANGPYEVDEGSSVVLAVTGSSDPNGDPLTYLWDFDDDGVFDDALGPNPSFLGVDDGVYPVELRVTDSLLDDTATSAITVNNVAPSVSAGLDFSIGEGAVAGFTGSFTDPGTADTHVFSWDFGDGSSPVSDSLTPTHTFLSDGVYTVSLTVTDDDGGVGVDSLVVTVTDGAPVAALSGPVTLTEGDTDLFDASASRSAPDTIAGFEWDFDYDGSFAPTGDTGATASHQFPEDGVYTVAVRVTDSDGSTDIATHAVTVNNAPPVVEAGPDQPGVLLGNPVVLAPSTFTDVGVEDTHTATIDWGDGSSAEPGTVGQGTGSGTVSGGHTYAAAGTYTVTVTVTDDDSGTGSDTLTVEIVETPNTAPIPDAGPGATIVEGDAFSGAGSFTDPDADTWSATVDYGDGTGVQPLSLTGMTFTLSHPYTDNGSYTVTVTVLDSQGGTNSDTATVVVDNANPVVDAGADQPGVGFGETVTLDPASFTDAGVEDTHISSIDWGDGAVESGVLSQGAGSGTVAGSHDYATAGDYTVAVTVTDNDGGAGSDTLLVTVLAAPNQPPQIVSTPVTSGTEGETYVYDVDAIDPDVGDVLTYSLDAAPVGMSIDPNTGLIQWTPSGSQLGSNPVSVRVEDLAGAFATQSYVIEVGAGNQPPQIVSTPVTSGTEGETYVYDVDAIDPDVGDVLTYSLDVAPTGMSIDPNTGLIQWTPSGSQLGSNPVSVRVEDLAGAFATQSYVIEVEGGQVEPPPAPSNLSARPKSTKVQLVWTHNGSDSYNVYRSQTQGGPYSLIATTTSTYSTYLDEGLTNGVTYYYVVTSVLAGQESIQSVEVSGTPTARTRTR